ncbi:hypothetical protein D8Y23_04835 [Microbacterium enclense]|uniref:DUF2993 domain-containing protein n=1 Tax=Microbacterium enclense TaxID=993073 RepID=A0A3S3MEX3_9MICO|nr:hypothetical protein [Microbacterium enclense]RWR21003.1 hypothetical protein D8Y23_04835 [Microbacterium enclense]
MTLLEDSTAVVSHPAPAPAVDEPPTSSFPTARVILLIVALLGLTVAAVLIGEAIARADVERSVEAKMRTVMSLPESQHVGVAVEGPVLLQGIVNRYENIHVSLPNAPFVGAAADLTATLMGTHLDNAGQWVPERTTLVASLNAAQATAFYIPEDARGSMQVGFRGADMTIEMTMSSTGTRVPMSVAVTPSFESGWLSTTLSSVTVGGTTISRDDVRARFGDEGLATTQTLPVCVAEGMPRAMTVREVAVRDQRLRMDVLIDLDLWDTPEGEQPGSCL